MNAAPFDNVDNSTLQLQPSSNSQKKIRNNIVKVNLRREKE